MRPKLHFLDRVPYRGFGPAEQGASGLVQLFFYPRAWRVPKHCAFNLNRQADEQATDGLQTCPQTCYNHFFTTIDHNRRCYRSVRFFESSLIQHLARIIRRYIDAGS